MMRAVERLAVRADLPLRYTQGFNPHPILSLVCPRPVGVSARDDLLVVTLDSPISSDRLLERISGKAPAGMCFTRATPLQTKRTPRPVGAEYRLVLRADQADGVRRRIEEARSLDAWTVQRLTHAKRRRGKGFSRTEIDLRPLVGDLDLEGKTLRFRLHPLGDLWARPGEVLRWLGLDERVDLASCVRTNVEYEIDTISA